jgi:pimeloyl-ACP methyl ester carboxylesterase
MTIVLVHGNPETEALWSPLVDSLGRDDVVRLSPPGFGAPLPEHFRPPRWRTATGSKTSWSALRIPLISSDTTGVAGMS